MELAGAYHMAQAWSGPARENSTNENMSDQPAILSQGYIVEVAAGGPWLKQDGTWTPNYDERGVWHEYDDAEMAIYHSLHPARVIEEAKP